MDTVIGCTLLFVFIAISVLVSELLQWPALVTMLVLLGLVIGIGVLIYKLNPKIKKLKSKIVVNKIKRNAWVFPMNQVVDFFDDNPTKSVMDAFRYVLNKYSIPIKYRSRYIDDKEIKEKVEEIRKAAFAKWEEAEEAKRQEEIAKKQAELAEKLKKWEQDTAKYTKYANRKGKEKSIQYCKDRIAYYKEIERQFSPEKNEAASAKMMGTTEKLYKASAQREHDWALHGGIAEGIAGTAAGVATALKIQQENAQIRSNNEALARNIADMNLAYQQALRDAEFRAYHARKSWEENLKTAQEATIKQEDKQMLMEILAPKLGYISENNDIHTMRLNINFDRKHIDVLKEMGYERPHVDGSIKMTVKYNGKVIATPICVLPFWGSFHDEASAVCKIPSNVKITYDNKKNVTAEFEPRDLWIVQNVGYDIPRDEQRYE